MKKSVKQRNKELLKKVEEAQLERRETAREVLRRMVNNDPPDSYPDSGFTASTKNAKVLDLRWGVLLRMGNRMENRK